MSKYKNNMKKKNRRKKHIFIHEYPISKKKFIAVLGLLDFQKNYINFNSQSRRPINYYKIIMTFFGLYINNI